MISRNLIALFIVLSIEPLVMAGEISAIQENNAAVRKLEQEDATGAEQQLLKALPEAPFAPILRMNLGLTYEVQKKYDRAQKEYESVTRVPQLDDEMRFNAFFNAGNAAAQNKNVDQALAHYQAALGLKPDSQEVKTNIEILMSQAAGKGKGEQGGGKGQDPNDQQNQGQGQNQPQDPQNQGEQKPEFKSQNLSKEDVRKIMEELKSQEKKIRALEYGNKGKEASPGNDW